MPGESPLLLWWTLGALFLAGAAIGSTSLLLPHPPEFNDRMLWSNIALSFCGALLCLGFARRLPRKAVHPVLVLGTIVITRAVYYSHDPSGFYAFFYIWVGMYAFFFFGRRGGVAHMAVVGITYGWVLAESSATGAISRWMMAISTIAVGGVMIDMMAGRLRHLAARFASLAGERAGLLAKLEEVARTDDLTGLPNRRSWDEELEREVARARREATPLCVAIVDLDRFKLYNDTYGHQAGDRMLKEVAAGWRRCLRTTDVLARYGGEEFSLALPGCDLHDGLELIERLRETVPQSQTCSAGIAVWDGHEAPATLLGRADAALYEAKAAGRDRVTAA
jgi:diguanylate cyclase (GGDEF)-like protein